MNSSAVNAPPLRLAMAVVVSIALHSALMVGLEAPAERAGAPTPLLARILPVSAPDSISVASVSAVVTEAERLAPPSRARAEATAEPSAPAPASAGASTQRKPASSLLPDVPRYYTSREVDLKALPIDIAHPSLSEKGMVLGRIVRVKLRLFIGETGKIDRFDVLETDAPAGSVSMEDVPEIRFHPAQRGGRPVKSQKVVELSFVP